MLPDEKGKVIYFISQQKYAVVTQKTDSES